MALSYNKLWKMLIDRNMTKEEKSFSGRLAMKNATVAEVYLGKTGRESPFDILPFEGCKLPQTIKEAC